MSPPRHQDLKGVSQWLTPTYPPNWQEIAYRIKEAAGWKCERCGAPNDYLTGHVLTVHHLDGRKNNCSTANLVALCQRCHLRVQRHYSPGQLSLPGLEQPWIQHRLPPAVKPPRNWRDT